MADNFKYNCGCAKSETLVQAHGVNSCVKGIKPPFFSKLPVVIAAKEVEIGIESCIELPCDEKYYEIKRTKKNLFLTQARVVSLNEKCGKLFLQGYIEKNIEYATADCVSRDKSVINGDIKHHTVKVPFHVITDIDFLLKPINKDRTSLTESDLYCDASEYDSCSCSCDGVKGKAYCESDFKESTVYNTRPFIKLDGFKIIELDMYKDATPLGGCYDGWEDGKGGDKKPEHEHEERCNCTPEYEGNLYSKIVEKMVLFLDIKVLQEQYVLVEC
ncbi:CsxC family protein [Clostridium sp. C8-1-8]|uniref:CsxC family protein n=1 Tax=Clostridium sp. C8-1-8 TaxID=2698831 RepID=UPI001370BC12|nr:hypothetical protein [Clostridium sp. C8-1-8]